MKSSVGCIFCAINSGEQTAEIVLETPLMLSFLDHRPLFAGHCLVIPRDHHETLVDLPDSLREPFLEAVQRVCGGVTAGMQAEGSLVAVNNHVSQSVPHLHAHVVPRRRGDGLRGFFWPRHPYPDAAAMREARNRIRRALPREGA